MARCFEMLAGCNKAVFVWATVCALLLSATKLPAGQPFVPGTGVFLENCCDDFEDPKWSYRYNHPKSSHEQDDRQRAPGGFSNNGLWHEGAKRGTPDLVKRVPTPPGGIAGSTGALLMATKMSGVPGKVSNSQQQDDLLLKVDRVLGGTIDVSWRPSCTVRVYLPEFEKWEKRSGPSFGMRADCIARTRDGENEHYWPGMFFLFRSERNHNIDKDFVKLTVRSNHRGQDVRSHDITEPGWWTLGMSFTPDGQVHYYASPGVDDLTEDDYLMSSFPYGYRTLAFDNFFFNVANWENGRNWSTAWVIDDPTIHVIPPAGKEVAQLYRKRKRGRNMRQQMTGRQRSNGRSAGRRSSSPGGRSRR